MNIKRAKEEIKNTIEAYLQKDAYGAYEIPSIRQRPVLLMGSHSVIPSTTPNNAAFKSSIKNSIASPPFALS